MKHLIFFLIFPLSVSSQDADVWKRIDHFAENTSPENFTDVNEFGNFINQHYSTANEKSRFIYTWIAIHISYDTDCFLGRNDNKQDAESVFTTKRAVCEGYANLFDKLCWLTGVTSMKVEGLGARQAHSQHAWNAIKVNGTWYLIDVTWASGGLDSSNQFEHAFSDYYFLTQPEQFIHEHLPYDPMWQLLRSPVTKKDFFNKKFAVISTIGSFSFEDTIANYLALDSVRREYDFYRRSFAFDPFNSLVKEGYTYSLMLVANSYIHQGDDRFNDYFKIKKLAFDSAQIFAGKREQVTLLLDSCSQYYYEANHIFQNLDAPSQPENLIALKENRMVIAERYRNLAEEKNFVKYYFSASPEKRASVLHSYLKILNFKF